MFRCTVYKLSFLLFLEKMSKRILSWTIPFFNRTPPWKYEIEDFVKGLENFGNLWDTLWKIGKKSHIFFQFTVSLHKTSWKLLKINACSFLKLKNLVAAGLDNHVYERSGNLHPWWGCTVKKWNGPFYILYYRQILQYPSYLYFAVFI